jgi:hypothetical protein
MKYNVYILGKIYLNVNIGKGCHVTAEKRSHAMPLSVSSKSPVFSTEKIG